MSKRLLHKHLRKFHVLVQRRIPFGRNRLGVRRYQRMRRKSEDLQYRAMRERAREILLSMSRRLHAASWKKRMRGHAKRSLLFGVQPVEVFESDDAKSDEESLLLFHGSSVGASLRALSYSRHQRSHRLMRTPSGPNNEPDDQQIRRHQRMRTDAVDVQTRSVHGHPDELRMSM